MYEGKGYRQKLNDGNAKISDKWFRILAQTPSRGVVGDVIRIETLKLESQKGLVITVILEGKMEHQHVACIATMTWGQKFYCFLALQASGLQGRSGGVALSWTYNCTGVQCVFDIDFRQVGSSIKWANKYSITVQPIQYLSLGDGLYLLWLLFGSIGNGTPLSTCRRAECSLHHCSLVPGAQRSALGTNVPSLIEQNCRTGATLSTRYRLYHAYDSTQRCR